MKCFADDCSNGVTCKILRVKECEGCKFFKTQEQFEEGKKINNQRLEYLSNKTINIFN